MIQPSTLPTGRERYFEEDEIIVSKTDDKGVITYTNEVFIRISGYSEQELLGQPHNIIRHPDMPRCVFKLLWDTIQNGDEIFAYVINLCKNGDHYWVLAHVTPSFDELSNITGYHSSRRVPERNTLDKVKATYSLLKKTEDSYSDWRDGMRAGTNLLVQHLGELGIAYDEFVFTL